MTEQWLVIIWVAAITLGIRLGGVIVGRRIPQQGVWARALNALPGCLIVSLVAVMVLSGGPQEWLAAAIALAVALVTKSLPVTMIAGIAAIWAIREFALLV
jgi:uncharacterized membrane protein